MSLKAFHMVFIVASFLLSIYVGVWASNLYTLTRSGSDLAMAVFFFVLSGVLVAYGFRAFHKLREIP